MARKSLVNNNGVDLHKACDWCRRQYNNLRKGEFRHCHSSHAAARAMEMTEKKFPLLSTFGVEGWCDDCGREGVSYLNTGDTYDLTICFHSGSERFFISSWGDAFEAWEQEHGPDCR